MKRNRLKNWSLAAAALLGCSLAGFSQTPVSPGREAELEAAKRARLEEMKAGSLYTPKITAREQDCPDAITICQDVYVQTQSYSGTGSRPNEINAGLSCLDGGEVNDVWYIFTAQNTGTLSFTITPLNPLDDYDWSVFNLTNATCSDIFYNPALEVSCNFSALPGPTGANGNTVGHAQNSPTLTVNAGETFVINVSNFSSTQSGYTLDFTASTVTLYDTVPPVAMGSEYVCNHYGVRITLNELCTCSTIAPDGSDFAALNQQGVGIPVIGAVGVGCTENNKYTNQIDVMIAAQTQQQTVTIALQQGSDGNTIGDKCLNWMTQLNQTATVQPKPVLNLGDDKLLCFFGVTYPLLDAGAGNQWVNYQWFRNGLSLSGDTLPTYQTASTGIYSVRVNNQQSADPCIYRDTVLVDVSVDYCMDNLPNAFSPNGDGVNDLYLQGADMIIENRWGQTLYKGNEGWDGTHAGSPVSNGTYYVVFKFTDSQGKEHIVKSPVTLIR